MDLWLGISHYSNRLMTRSNNLAVAPCLMNSHMQAMKRCLYQIHPPEQYHVVDSPVWPVAVNAQVAVPEPTADLPDSEYRVNSSVNLPVARDPPPDPNPGPNVSDVWHLHRFLQDEHPIASETLSDISRMTISKWIYQSYHHCAMQI